MDSFSQVRRILHMHPAHRTVGVSGVAAPFRVGFPLQFQSADGAADTLVRISLVPCTADRRIAAAMAAFERILAGSSTLRCDRVSFATAEKEGLGEADCAVVFGRGLQVVGRWSAVDAGSVASGDFEGEEGFETEVEVAPAARRHPVVDGVGTFIARRGVSQFSHSHQNVTCLLVRKWADRVFPVAWARESDGRAFYTSLGHPDDFRRREFVRLLWNAIQWTAVGYRFRQT
jgi:hypothetical protein